MSVDQARGIIDHARQFHKQVGAYYHHLADHSERERLRLLLEYMSRHEERLEAALADYEGAAPAKILDTWLQSANETDAFKTACDKLRTVKIDSSSDVDDIMQLGVELSDCLIGVYRDLAQRAEPDSVQQVFENLLHMEEKAQRQFVRDAERLADL
jgi:hypothetical protein